MDAAGAVAGMRGGEERLLAELAAALVQEGDHRLVLLADDRDEVRPAVAVEVRDRHVDGAVAVVNDVRHELRLGPVGRLIFEEEDLAGGVEAEGGDDQVELARAAEVGGLHVGHPADALQQSDGRVGAVGPAAQPDDAAALAVGRLEAAEVGDDDVEDAVAVQVHHLGVAGVRHRRQHAPGGVGLGGLQQHDPSLARGGAHVAGEDVGPAAVAQVDQVDVGDVHLPVDGRRVLDLLEARPEGPGRVLQLGQG